MRFCDYVFSSHAFHEIMLNKRKYFKLFVFHALFLAKNDKDDSSYFIER